MRFKCYIQFSFVVSERNKTTNNKSQTVTNTFSLPRAWFHGTACSDNAEPSEKARSSMPCKVYDALWVTVNCRGVPSHGMPVMTERVYGRPIGTCANHGLWQQYPFTAQRSLNFQDRIFYEMFYLFALFYSYSRFHYILRLHTLEG